MGMSPWHAASQPGSCDVNPGSLGSLRRELLANGHEMIRRRPYNLSPSNRGAKARVLDGSTH